MTLRESPVEIVTRAESSPNPGLLARAPHWNRVPLGEVAHLVNGAPFRSDLFNSEGHGLPLIRIRDVGAAVTRTWYSGGWMPRDLVGHGDILIGMDGDFRIARWLGGKALLNQRVCRVEVDPTRYDARFLMLVLQGYLDAIWKATSSVTVKHLSSRSIAEIPLPHPTLDEQRRIVDILEDHLSRLEVADSSLRFAVTRAAALERTALARCHEGAPTALREVAEMQGGIQKQPRRAPKHRAYPFLRVANVTASGLDLGVVHRVELFDGELDRLRLRRGDLLVVEGNGSPSQIGRAAAWDGSIDDCVHQNHLIRVRPSRELLPAFLEAVWNSPQNRSVLTEISSSSSGLHTLSVSKLKSLIVPVPSMHRQEELVAAVAEARVARARLDEQINRALRWSQVLRRSLLAAAFSGRLTGTSADLERAEEMVGA